MDTVNLKSNLGYVVAKRRGSVTELEEKIGRKPQSGILLNTHRFSMTNTIHTHTEFIKNKVGVE